MAPTASEISPELVAKYDRPGPRYTSYPTVPAWSEAFGPEDFERQLDAANERRDDSLALYLHLPFCAHRCLFCGCNVVITSRHDVVEEYLARLFREIEHAAECLPDRRRLTGLHWGGGTPTHLDCEQIERVHGKVAQHFAIEPDGEIAIEVHPPETTREQLETLRRLGFNRISLGVQDLDTEVQQVIERWQTVEQTERLLDWSRELGFRSVNFDLIYGLPAQTPDTWELTLRETLRMRPDRLAIYSYAHVPWIKPHQNRMPGDRLPDAETKMALFRHARRRLLDGGYVEIGMDHFALPQDELARAVSDRRLYRNFMGYTVRPAADFLGLGASAISEVGHAFAQNSGKLNRWSEAVDAGRFGTERGFRLSLDDRVRKLVIERLMCNLQVRFEEVEALAGAPFREIFAAQWAQLAEFEADGLVERGEHDLTITSLGRTLIRNVAMLFDAHLPDPGGDQPIFSRTV
ncbi:MAG TPA: oxygen-independent coproporphyrinogen III oxidase [Planctomycetota bacterium]